MFEVNTLVPMYTVHHVKAIERHKQRTNDLDAVFF
jgi:hypothetical protein